MTKDSFEGVEWTVDEWQDAWSIRVGRVYACAGCGSMVMVTKGGIGVLEPTCCGKPMKIVENPDSVE
jgi:hypothetical protein